MAHEDIVYDPTTDQAGGPQNRAPSENEALAACHTTPQDVDLLYAEISATLDAYDRQLTDILDHVTSEEEVQAYGDRSATLADLRARWNSHLKVNHPSLFASLNRRPCRIRVLDESGQAVLNQGIVADCLDYLGLNPRKLGLAPCWETDGITAGYFSLCMTSDEADDATYEEAWVGDHHYAIEILHPCPFPSE